MDSSKKKGVKSDDGLEEEQLLDMGFDPNKKETVEREEREERKERKEKKEKKEKEEKKIVPKVSGYYCFIVANGKKAKFFYTKSKSDMDCWFEKLEKILPKRFIK